MRSSVTSMPTQAAAAAVLLLGIHLGAAEAAAQSGPRSQATARVSVEVIAPPAEPALVSAAAPRVLAASASWLEVSVPVVVRAAGPYRLVVHDAGGAALEAWSVSGAWVTPATGGVVVARSTTGPEAGTELVEVRYRLPRARAMGSARVLPVRYEVAPLGTAGPRASAP